jgi:hypothetical protein
MNNPMHTEDNNLPPPVNHVFVDFENVRGVDPAIIGAKTVHLTLLLGASQTKLEAALVENLLQHAATVKLVRLASSGRNALDFTLAYYLGRAVLADPCGYFHIVSKDTGYDPLIEHLRGKHIHARRHDDFTTLAFSASAKTPPGALPPIPPPAASKSKSSPKPKPPPSAEPTMDELERGVLEHFRKPAATRPRTKTRLLSFLVAHHGNKITQPQASSLVESLSEAGHLQIDANDKVTYHLDQT